ncbi:hypothetical protein J1N35_015734 [Gossypium stocksii]|uniref:RNase H type-1 domain-containing protein n=1 Tax=Gossypium stocksii TaxID=47602 RepID=A0A9D3VXG5_9ROSI|nr:hypothetical protein J1N35_015734 [Gossypium stocksii]
MICTYSLEVSQAIEDGQSRVSNSTLIRRILQFLDLIGQWRLRYVSREENKAIDFLAKISSDRKQAAQVFDEVSGELIAILKFVTASDVFVS